MSALVLVTGQPGTGKSSLAVPLADLLAVPLYAKDAVKESLADAEGAPATPEASKRLSARAFEELYRRAALPGAAVVDANFGPEAGARLRDAGKALIEIHCTCAPKIALERYRSRSRHPIHRDEEMAQVIEERLRSDPGPLRLGGPLLVVDTGGPVDAGDVAAWVRALPEWADQQAGQ